MYPLRSTASRCARHCCPLDLAMLSRKLPQSGQPVKTLCQAYLVRYSYSA